MVKSKGRIIEWVSTNEKKDSIHISVRRKKFTEKIMSIVLMTFHCTRKL